MSSERIVEGIEYFETPYGEDVQCARCGSSAGSVECDNCGGDGRFEDDWEGVETFATCDVCRGHGGWYVCLSSPEWCEANPMPSREHIVRHTTTETVHE